MSGFRTKLFLSAAIIGVGATTALAERDGNDSAGVIGMSSPGFFAAGDSLDGFSGDNLGNHQANADLDMGGNAIVDMGEPMHDGDAATKYYVDVKSGEAKDNLGNHVATRVLDMNGNAITGLADPSTSTSGINLRTLEKMIGEIEGDNLGDHKATTNLDMNGNRIEFTADPQNPRDVATKQYVDGLVTSIDLPDDISGNRINAGTGLIGGGPLSSDVTLSFNRSWGDGVYALRDRILTAGDGLDGGGPLSANLTFNVDGTVVRTTGNQSVAGAKTFTLPVSVASPTGNAHAATKKYVDDLVSSSILTYAAGDGMSLSAARIFSVDGTVVRTTGNQAISGLKSFGSPVTVGTPTAGGHATTKTYVDGLVAGATGGYTAGDGLTLSGKQFSLDNTSVRTAGNQSIAGTKTFTDPINVRGTFDVNGTAAGAQPNGFYVSDLGGTKGTTDNPTTTLGIMAQTSASRSIGLSVDGQGNIYGFRSHSNAGTYTWKSKVKEADAAIAADRLSTARTINGVSFNGSANITLPTVNTTGNQTVAGTKTFSSTIAGSINGNAATASRLATARNINGVSFDGSAAITLPTVNLTGNQSIAGTKTFSALRLDGNLNANGNTITGLAEPTGGAQAATKSYVDAADAAAVKLAGAQTITGQKTFNTSPVVNGWGGLVLNSAASSPSNILKLTPNDLAPQTDTHFRVGAGYANTTVGNRIQLFLSAGDTYGEGGTTNFNSPALLVQIPKTAQITNSSLYGNGVDPSDGGSGVISSMTYRFVHFFRQVGIDGGLHVYSSTPGRVAKFNVPLEAYNGIKVNPGTGGEIRMHGPVYGHSFNTFSDASLKENVASIQSSDALELLSRIRPVSYNLKESGNFAYGVIAQEFQDVMPWAVHKTEDGLLAVDYTQIVPPLALAVSSLKEKNDTLRGEIEDAKKSRQELENRIARLEKLIVEQAQAE